MAGMAPTAAIGAVHLNVRDPERSVAFYERALGMRSREGDDGTVVLGAADGGELLVLHPSPGGAPLDRGLTGLYHFAVLVPSRHDLADALMRVVVGGWALDGASDHLVSEALYLSDPEGNGIEIYRDRERAQWPRADDGSLQMGTLPLDLNNVAGELGEARNDPAPQLPAGTKIGHVHLQVEDLRAAEEFYSGVLGFDVVVRGYPGALFVSAGGYHHHVGLNTWHSRGADAPAPGSAGLAWYEIRVGDEAGLAECIARLEAAGVLVESAGDGWMLRDPSGNGVLLRA
jgi:catechol 2,3-dioxygenase